jgi:UDP-glucuronate decarboxylase
VHYQREPLLALQTSVLGAMQLLELSRRTGAKVLQASTSEVYGDPAEHPQQEGYWGHVNPIGVRACYDEGKRCAETVFFDYHRRYGIPIKVVRIFNTYGPYMQLDDGRVISNFIVQALRGEPLTVYGDGTQTRSFCYADDLVDGLVRMMESPAAVIGPVNLGNPDEYTVAELARQVRECTGSRAAIVFRPLPHDDPRQRRPDISRARELLGWQPRVDLSSGLRETIGYFQRCLERAGDDTVDDRAVHRAAEA